MYYFLGDNLPEQLSGIEHAQIKRLRLFAQHGVAAKIFTRKFNRYLHHQLKSNGLTDGDVLNMYDWIQGANETDYQIDFEQLVDVPQNAQKEIDQSTGRISYKINNIVRVSVTFFPFNHTKINSVEYRDAFGNVTQRDLFDVRGFVSLRQFMDQNGGGVVTEQMLHPDGTIALTLIYRPVNNGYQATGYKLFNYFNQDWYFDNENQLVRFVLDELQVEEERKHGNKAVSTFIADRDFGVPMSWMGTKNSRKFIVWHNIQTENFENIHGPLYGNYQFQLENAKKFDGIIVPTASQAADIVHDHQPKLPILEIPVGYVGNKKETTPMANRAGTKLISISRIDYQKRLEDTIAAFDIIQKSVKDATLEIWGFVYQQDLFEKLKQQINSLNLADKVIFKGYSNDMDAVYQSAKLMLMTSRYEGSPLSIVESLYNGTPVVSYDINYGPRDVIIDNRDGAIVKSNSIDEMATKVINILMNEQNLQTMSQNAQDEIQKMNSENVWQIWKEKVIKNYL